MKIVYLGYDALFPALEEIASQGCDLLELFTCRTDNITEYNHQVIEFAKRNGLPYHLDPITLEDLHRLEQVGCELILCAGYYHRIPTDTSIAMVNIHPSLLPHGRGAWPMPHAILNQDTTTGLSLHKLSERFDQGDLILQRPCAIAPDETLETLTQKLQEIMVELLREFLPQWRTHYRNATPQGKGSYLPYLQETDFPITPTTTVSQADRILRAFYGYECLYQGEQTYGLLRGRAVFSPLLAQEPFPLADGAIHPENARQL